MYKITLCKVELLQHIGSYKWHLHKDHHTPTPVEFTGSDTLTSSFYVAYVGHLARHCLVILFTSPLREVGLWGPLYVDLTLFNPNKEEHTSPLRVERLDPHRIVLLQSSLNILDSNILYYTPSRILSPVTWPNEWKSSVSVVVLTNRINLVDIPPFLTHFDYHINHFFVSENDRPWPLYTNKTPNLSQV